MFTYSRNHSEKRNYMRMVMNCPMTYQEVGSDQQFSGTCLNLSAKGILIASHVYFSAGTRLEVHIEPHLAISPTFDAIVEIVRVDQSPESRILGLGARVIEILK